MCTIRCGRVCREAHPTTAWLTYSTVVPPPFPWFLQRSDSRSFHGTETSMSMSGPEGREGLLRSLVVSDGSLSLLRKFVRLVPPVETALMEADEDVRSLEADFR